MSRAIWVCIFFIAFLPACTRDEASQCPNCPTISFKADIIPIFTASCAIPSCHDAITDTFHLDLDSANAYFGATEPGTGNVTPYSAGNSLLYTILLGTGGANHMPPLPFSNLPPCQIQAIGCWINQGAKNN